MCKIYCVLVFLMSLYKFNSATDNDYYQYVINDKRLPCVSNTDCYNQENNQMNLKYNEDEDESEEREDFGEDILYDEDIDFVPYDAINDAVQEVNAQKNIFQTMNTRRTRNIANRHSEHIYDDIEELHRKHLKEKTSHRNIAQNGECTESDKYCELLNDPNIADHVYENNGMDSEFYQDGMTKDNLLERKKLELLRDTFTKEKSNLLETDQFIHQIISHLGDLEKYEFDAANSKQVLDYDERIPDIHDEKYQFENVYPKHQVEYHGSPESCPPNTKIESNENEREEINNDYDLTVKETPKFRSLNRQEGGGGGEEEIANFEDFGPDELTNIGTGADAYVSEEEEEEEEVGEEDDSYDDGRISSPMVKAQLGDIIKDANMGEEDDNNRDKFVLSKKQYAEYLTYKQPGCQPEQEDELNSAEYDVYKIETEKSQHKRKVNNGLHPSEVPKFEENIPKIHKLSDHLVEKLWKEYKAMFKKNYKGVTDFKKKHHWKSNHKRIHEHNEEAQRGLHTYTLKENHLTDLHPRHYMRQMSKLTHSRIRKNMLNLPETNDSVLIPDHLDWREAGFITPDWNQEDCGACYAFSVATAIQGQLFMKTSNNEDLSIQQVVDCSILSGNLGCAGGSLRNTLNYVQFAGGLMKDEDYPYKGKQSICKFKKLQTVVDISSWSVLPPQDEHALKVALATVGPLAVSINASPHTFQLYSSGIYNDDACSSDYVNHAMLLIGYTRNSWILKNWWSDKWGDKGYMYLKRGHNRCGIANYAVYALL